MDQDTLAFTSNAAIEGDSVVQLNADDCKRVSIKTEKHTPRQRRIIASVAVPRSFDQVWKVLTDYESLSDFVPNLTSSRLLPCPNGGIRLEQIGAQCFLNFKF